MAASSTAAARGTIMLVVSRGGYFVLGYLAVVLLARGLGPAAYGAYGVIMSVLVWLEQVGKFAIPSAAVKLLAATSEETWDSVAKSTAALNLCVFFAFFVLMWVAAPWLAAWFGLAGATALFRLAAVDFPFFGMYTAFQSIHQGHRRFVRLGIAELLYALAKLVGIALLLASGISIETGLWVNIFASIVGAVVLCSRIGLGSPAPWFAFLRPMMSIALPMGLYSLSVLLLSSMGLWVLQMLLPASEAAQVGVFVAALNIARVPGFGLSAVAQVLLPSVSRAASLGDVLLIKRYLHQGLRFFLLFYLPICLLLMVKAEDLMVWVYSSKYTGGGPLLSILLIAYGLWSLHAILGSVLIALGQARASAAVMGLCIVPSIPVFFMLVSRYAGVGAAVASIVTPLLSIILFIYLLRRQYGNLVESRSTGNIALAAGLMLVVHLVLPQRLLGVIPILIAAMVAYGGTLIAVGEIGKQDLATLTAGKKHNLA